MQEDFGPDFITIVDDEGTEIELEFVDALEYEGCTYMAFFPTSEEEEVDEDSEDYGLIILKSEEENGESFLAIIDDEALLEKVYQAFMERFLEEEE